MSDPRRRRRLLLPRNFIKLPKIHFGLLPKYSIMHHLKYSFFDRLVCKDSRNRENQESKETLFSKFDILKSKYWRCKWSVATVWNITVDGKLTVYFYFHVM